MISLRGQEHIARTRPLMGAACAAALVLSGLAFPAPADAADELPILGQAWTTSVEDTAEDTLDVVISVHGVRRIESATMVYWSVGFTPDSSNGDNLDLVQAFGSHSTLSPPRDGTETMGDVAVVDLAGKKAYTTLYTGDRLADCVCTSFTQALPDEPEPGTAYATAAALPPIPQGVDTVTLRVAGQLIPDVPVEDGAMEPVAKGDDPIVVGTGWPKVDTEAISEVKDPSAFIVPLTTHTVIEDSAISERSDADSHSLDLSADVLFAFDKATLTGKAMTEIKTAAKTIKGADVDGTLTVTGHTDSEGAADYNQDLSERRAESVAKALKPLLPSGTKLTAEGKGESEPVASNETDEGQTLNRRVTITLPEEQ